MKKYIFMAVVFLLLPAAISASMLSSIVTGMILLDVEHSGEAWYVEPDSYERHFLNRPSDAFEIMRELGLGITTADLEKIPVYGEWYDGDKALRDRLSGKILLQVESKGEAWYVYPADQKRYYLGRPADAFEIMSDLGLGITSINLSQIPIAGGDSIQEVSMSSYTHVTDELSTDRGVFSVQYIKLERDGFTMMTDTAEEGDCEGGCDAKYLEEFVQENSALIGIHGTYFCPPDYSSCSGQVNAFDPPVYNSATGFMLNEFDLPHHNGPMVAVDTLGQYYYYHRATDFGDSVSGWEQDHGVQLQASMAHYPSLIEDGMNVVSDEVLQTSMHSSATRGGIGYDDTFVYLVVATGASVTDLASIFDTLNVDYAMNLDGGASTALYADGTYLYGPNRQNPNVIVFKSNE